MKIGDRVRIKAGAFIGRLGTMSYIGQNQCSGYAYVRLDGLEFDITFYVQDIEPGLLDELASLT